MAHQETYRRKLAQYRLGLLLAGGLTLAPAALVLRGSGAAGWTLACVMLLGLAQILVHVRCFLDVRLRGGEREHRYVLLFSALIVLLMVGGTLLVFFDQMARM